jgi:hypothetical protein
MAWFRRDFIKKMAAASLVVAPTSIAFAKTADRPAKAQSSSDLERRLERMEAIHEVQNLAGQIHFLTSVNLYRKCLPLFALDTPGVRVEMDWGVYEGKEGVKRFFLGYHGTHEAEQPDLPDLKGDMHLHMMTTPVVQVADDLQTARGAWMSPGYETMGHPQPDGSKKFIAEWIFLKYGIDFVKEDGKWKIWHMHTFVIFVCPYDKSWTEVAYQQRGLDLPAEKAPDRIKPYPPLNMYGIDKRQINVPVLPEHYATFNETTSY